MQCRSSGTCFTAWLGLALACASVAPGAAAPPRPQPVSPGAAQPGAVAEARCPTFSWAGVPRAAGYEVAVFRLGADGGGEPELVTRVALPADTRSWTPPVGQCLERGVRYGWSVAATADAREDASELDDPAGSSRVASRAEWSAPLLFEVEAAPSRDELEEAVATIRSHLERTRTTSGDTTPSSIAALPTPRPEASRDPTGRPGPTAQRPRVAADRVVEPGALDGLLETGGPERPQRIASAAATPTQGAASLSVSNQIHLAAQSDLFKDDSVFLWDDDEGNTALGRNALASVSGTADHNTALGRGALRNTTGAMNPSHGSDNTAVGDRALYSNIIGFFNTAVGSDALFNNIQGNGNTAVGGQALLSNTSGFFNTATGWSALLANSTGTGNTASGFGALGANTTTSFNSATGFRALYKNTGGDYNAASGAFALYENTSGYHNTATGAYALSSNTSAFRNTASGFGALRDTTTGSDNTAHGAYALRANTIGFSNTAIGFRALEDNVDGTRNTASGHAALSNSTTGQRNVAHGNLALTSNTTGSRNTALGDRAGYHNTTGSDSIFVNNEGAAGGGDNAVIKIGTEGTQTSTSIAGIHAQAVDGDTAVTVLVDDTGKLGTVLSSRRFKQDIQGLGALADRLLALRPVAFRYRQHAASNPGGPLHFGLIAEEVAEVFPELVVFDENGKPQTVKYHLLSSLLLGVLQKEHAENLETRRRLEALESLITDSDNDAHPDARRRHRRGTR